MGREIRGRADGMPGWVGKELGGESPAGPDTGASEVEVEVWDRVGLGGVERGCLIEEPGEEIALGRSARGREGRGLTDSETPSASATSSYERPPK